ncbi:MAG TPA: hypothetical protein VGI43_17565 [Mucilaginibacter sp.]|jgi:hypothetical protein
MEELGIYNNRKLIYQRHGLDVNWTKSFPDKNWLLLVVSEGKEKAILAEISRKAIDKNVCYICCAGEQSKLLHDMIDDEIAYREVDVDNHHLPPYDVIMTTWDIDFSEATWFAIFAAYNDPEIINSIICLDASEMEIKSKLENLVRDFV